MSTAPSDLKRLISTARSVNGVPFTQFSSPFTSLGDLLVTRTEENRERTWVSYFDENEVAHRFSRGEFLRHVNGVARYFHRSGATRGSRIAVIGHNHVETVVIYFAAWMIGATVVPINVGEDDDRISYILENSLATIATVRSEYAERIARLLGGESRIHSILLSTSTPGEATHDIALIASASVGAVETYDSVTGDEANTHPLLPRIHLLDHECLIVYTSGTTGAPKGVLLTHGNLLADAEGISRWHAISEKTTMMCVLPIHHVNGTVVTLVTPLYADAEVVLERKFRTGSFFPRIASESVSIVSVVPTLLAYLSSEKIDRSGLELEGFRHIICGAGPLTCELAERFEQMYNVPIIHGYGLSETTCYSCFLPIDLSPEEHHHWLQTYGFPSIGVPIPQNEMAIHDERGNDVGDGNRGEIVIRGHNVMQEYYNNSEANRKAFEFGWFRSGDEGFRITSEDGTPYYFITGRLKELIIRGGVNLSPLEIDEVLNSHPGIEAGIAVGFENSWYGEEVGAYVRRKDPDLTEEQVIDYCAEHLPWSKQPKVVVFGDDIPVTSTGKYQRNRVKHHFADQKEAQYRDPSKK